MRRVAVPGSWRRRRQTGHGSSPTTETNLIYPGLGKEPQGVLALLFEAFRQHLRRPELRAVVAIGYGFADDHICSAVLEAMASNPALQLLLACGCPKTMRSIRAKLARKAGCNRFRSRISLLPSGYVPEVFETGALQNALSELEFIGVPASLVKPLHGLFKRMVAPDSGLNDVVFRHPAVPRSLSRKWSRGNLSLLCLGRFTAICSLDANTLLLTTVEGASAQLLRFDLRDLSWTLLNSWLGSPNGLAVLEDGSVAVLDGIMHGFEAGFGTCWAVDLRTGKRRPLLRSRVLSKGGLKRFLRDSHQLVSDTEQSKNRGADFGLLAWPTATVRMPGTKSLLIAESLGVLRVDLQRRPVEVMSLTKGFLNLGRVTHYENQRYLLLEGVRGRQGVLWQLDAGSREVTPLVAGLREPTGLLVLPQTSFVLLTENLGAKEGKLWCLDLRTRHSRLLLGSLDEPGAMVLLSDGSAALAMRGGLWRVALDSAIR